LKSGYGSRLLTWQGNGIWEGKEAGLKNPKQGEKKDSSRLEAQKEGEDEERGDTGVVEETRRRSREN